MTIHYKLEIKIRALERLQEEEQRRQRLRYLPTLTNELNRATESLNGLLSKYRLWVDVYQQPAFPSNQSLKQASRKPLGIISRSSDVFSVEEHALQEFRGDIRDVVDRFSKWERELERKLEAFCEEHSTTVETTKTLLRIPDFFDEDAERQRIEQLLDEVLDLLQLEGVEAENVERLADKWSTTWGAFQELQSHLSLDALRQRFNLSEETTSVVEQLIAGDALRLGEMSTEVLDELQQIQHFASQISLRFEAE